MKAFKHAAIAALTLLAAGEAHAKGCLLLPVNPLQDGIAPVGQAFTYTFPADSFDAFQDDGITWCCDLQADVAYDAFNYDGGNYSPLPAWLSFDPGTRTFSGLPSSGDLGTTEIVVTVSGCGGSTEDMFNLSVSEGGSGGGGVVGTGTRFYVRKLINEAALSSSSSSSSSSSGSSSSSSSSGGSSSGGEPLASGWHGWGWNGHGQLANGEINDAGETTPIHIPNLSSFVSLAPGFEFACGLTSSGDAYCWGSNWSGQLGNNTYNDSQVPVQVSGLADVTKIAVGYSHACALKSDGSVWCWGGNQGVILGGGTPDWDSPIPLQVTDGMGGFLSGIVDISTTEFATCSINNGGSVLCWGTNNYGTLGDGTYSASATPVTALVPVAASSFGSDGNYFGQGEICVIGVDNNLYCWGNNTWCQLGYSTDPAWSQNTPQIVSSPGGPVSTLYRGESEMCAVMQSDGSVKCWGINGYGELGTGDTNPVACGTTTTLPGVTSPTTMAFAGTSLCWLSGGGVSCQGANELGDLGDGSLVNSLTPVTPVNMGSGITRLYGGYEYYFAYHP